MVSGKDVAIGLGIAGGAAIAGILLFSYAKAKSEEAEEQPPEQSTGTNTIEGYVYDYNTGNPIEGAYVSLSGRARSFTKTDSNGYFRFTSIADGTYSLLITKSGYADVSDTISVSGGKTVTRQYYMQPSEVVQTATIKGKVYDPDGVIPIEGAIVGLMNTNYYTTTDANGYFELRDIPYGNYKLYAIKQAVLGSSLGTCFDWEHINYAYAEVSISVDVPVKEQNLLIDRFIDVPYNPTRGASNYIPYVYISPLAIDKNFNREGYEIKRLQVILATTRYAMDLTQNCKTIEISQIDFRMDYINPSGTYHKYLAWINAGEVFNYNKALNLGRANTIVVNAFQLGQDNWYKRYALCLPLGSYPLVVWWAR